MKSTVVLLLLSLAACGPTAKDPDAATSVPVDRFSASAGHLFARATNSALPGPNMPVDFDHVPGLITQGRGPNGELVRYYNFDVQPTAPSSIYQLVTPDGVAVANQLPIVDALPGDTGYSDFFQVMQVTIPAGYLANSVASLSDIQSAGYPIVATMALVDWPIVPSGSTATQRYGGADATLHRGWYRGQIVWYFRFDEHALSLANGMVPVDPVYVTFVRNPSSTDPTSGPPSGFVVEPGTSQTHNVVSTLPPDLTYTPLWAVDVYDNADFAGVSNLQTAQAATLLVRSAAIVSCPVVFVQ